MIPNLLFYNNLIINGLRRYPQMYPQKSVVSEWIYSSLLFNHSTIFLINCSALYLMYRAL